MKKLFIFSFVLMALSLSNVEASDRERAVYVGEGRYMGEGKSVDSAILRQRNNEWTQRQQDRYEYQQERDSYERRERQRDLEDDYEFDTYERY